jgi:putative membrane protein
MTNTQQNHKWLIILPSILIPIAVTIMYLMPKPDLGELNLKVLPFINAILNAIVSVLLIVGFIFIVNKKVDAHKKTMLAAFALSAVFLILYVVYHTLSEETHFEGQGWIRPVYYFLLITHIVLAAVILPLILITLSRGLQQKFDKHRKIAKITLPLWLYVTVTGVIVYFMIAPYYH